MPATPTSVVLYVDPSCPFAWITSRWLLEVRAQCSVDVEFRLMSLSVLNEGRTLEPWYREFNDLAWGPARVGAAVQERHGAEAFGRFYGAYGTHKHTEGGQDRAACTAAALADIGLPAELAAEATASDLDGVLRATHDQVRARVGDELGTPVIVVDGAAFFGPVCNAIPRGDAAVFLFEAVVAASRCPSFAELKRGRGDDLDFS